MAADPRGEELVGRTLGDFVLGDILGAGGFGAVYAARQPALERDAVIKILASEHGSQRHRAERFLREAKLASRLDHPFAAHIYNFGAEDDGLLWIAMERVRGTTLRELLATRGPLRLAQFVPFFERLAEVVAAAHDQAIIHRDLKPENVMVVSRGGRLSPKLLDLGIARLADDDGEEGSPAAPLADGPIDRLTKDGGITGSPHYMAPEQWVAPRSAGAAADQYALAAIAYESLTGLYAFPGTRIFEVARRHAKSLPPSLPAELPAALDAVIRRGLAKKPADRFASVAELATAIRDASDLTPESMLLPELDGIIASEFTEAGPQPIAAAVTAYSVATTIARARAALCEIVRASCHTLAVLALATRARLGGSEISGELAGALAGLRQNGTSDAGWLKLSALLTRHFAERPDVHPIPELVLLFHGESASPLLNLFELPIFSADAGGGESDLLADLRGAVPAIDALLARLRFLFEYPIVVRDGDGVLAWCGARPRRHRQPVEVDSLTAGQPMCLDATGSLACELYPLVQAAPPSRDAEPELFLLAGPGRRGARLQSHPAGLAIEDDELWTWFAAALEIDLDDKAMATVSERAPYRGLAPFSATDSDWFFGREAEAQALANRLSQTAFVAVVGPSGAGKSSFIKAGVVPIMAGQWQVIELRPGHRPLAALAAALEGAGYELGPDADLLSSLSRSVTGVTSGALIVVDQFEELYTLCTDEAERARFALALDRAASDPSAAIRLVITLRDDFLMRAEAAPGLGERLATSLELLGTPSKAGLRRILLEPARRAGFSFEDDELVDEMIAAVADKPGALPLLSFTAAKLWDLRDRHFKTLSRVAYESLGGVGGALAQHASAILESMNEIEVGLVREAFRHLVTAQGTRAILSRVELEQLLGGDPASDASSHRVIERLIGGRLLVASESVDGSDQVEITHEALLEAWPQLVEWRHRDAENARLRDQLRAAARQWAERDRPRGLLWRAEALTEYTIWRARYPGRLTQIETEFGNASVGDAARLRTVRRLLLGAAFVALSVALVVIYRAEVRARSSAALSDSRLAVFYREQGRRELAGANPAHALVYLSQIASRAAGDPIVSFLYARAREAFAANRLTLRASKLSLFGIGVSADGARAVTVGEDATPRLWDLKSGALIKEVEGVHRKVLYTVSFAPDGRFVTSGEDAFATVFDADGERALQLVGHRAGPDQVGIYAVRFDAAGERIISASGDSTAKVWDGRSGAELATLAGHESDVFDARFSADGRRALTASVDGTARLWDIATATSLAVMDHHEGLVWTAQWSPDERFIATVSADGKGAICDGRSGELRHWLLGHNGWVTDVAFSQDSRLVVTVSRDATALVFELETGKRVAKLEGHAGQVNRARFVGTDRVATASADGSVRIWNLSTGALEEIFVGHTSFIYGAELVAGGALLTSSWDGTARLWDLQRRRIPLVATSDRQLSSPAETRFGVGALVADAGGSLAIAADRSSVLVSRLGEAPTGRRVDHVREVTAVGISGDQLAIGDAEGHLRLVSLDGDGDGDGADVRLATNEPIRAVVAIEDSTWIAIAGDGILSAVGRDGARLPLVFAPVDRAELDGVAGDHVADLRATGPREITLTTARRIRRFSLEKPQAPEVVITAGDPSEPGAVTEFGAFAVSADGGAVAASSLELVTVVRRDGTTRTLREAGRPTALALSADGRRLLAGSEGGEVSLWNVETGAELDRQAIHGGWVTSLSIDSSGRFAISASADQRARIFDVAELVVLDTLELRAGEVFLARFVQGGERALVWAPALIATWNTAAPSESALGAKAFADCHVGWELAGGRIAVRKQVPERCAAK